MSRLGVVDRSTEASECEGGDYELHRLELQGASVEQIRVIWENIFPQKIREIDKDLGIYVSPSNSVQIENAFSKKETSPLFDLDKLRNGLEENECPHQAHNPILTSHGSLGTRM